MENASKALVMAGTILISLIIIGALIFMFRGLTSYQKTSESVLGEKQIADFNKEYTSFEKNLYGSELLSLINKAVDYNTQNKEDGYTPIKITFTVNRGTGSNNSSSLIKSGPYSIETKDTNIVATTLLVTMENIKTKYGGDKYLQRLVSLANKGDTAEIESVLKQIKNNYTYDAQTKKDISLYSEYMEFKRKKFRYEETIYDGEKTGAPIKKTNGRIVEMQFTEI